MTSYILRMHSVQAKIDMASVSEKLSAHYIPANLDIEKTPAQLNMQSKNITVKVDQSECFAEEGHKTVGRLISDSAAEGIESVKEYAHEAAVEGDMFVQSQKGENVIEEISKTYLSGYTPNSGIKFIPSERPKITWNENEISVDWHPASNDYNWSTSSWADINVEREGSVAVDEVQEQHLYIDCVKVSDAGCLLDVTA